MNNVGKITKIQFIVNGEKRGEPVDIKEVLDERGVKMSKKVWVATRFAHQSDRCFGVFSSEDKAYEYVKAVALKEVKENPMGHEKQMKEKTVIDRYWEDLQLDITEEEVDPVVSDLDVHPR